MRFDELTLFVQNRIWLRKLVFILIRLTTLREWYLSATLRKILPTLPRNFVFLDAGCGLGQFAFQVAKAYPFSRIKGVEQDSARVTDNQAVAFKWGLKNLSFSSEDITALKDIQSYHVILCNSVLEHVEDDEGALKHFYHALREKGILIIYVPSQEKRVLKPLQRLQEKQLSQSTTGKLHDHVRYYNKNQLLEKTNAAGFTKANATITYGRFGRWSYDLVTFIQYHRYVKWLFPLYLIFLHPAVMILMWLDFIQDNDHGNGLMLVCQK